MEQPNELFPLREKEIEKEFGGRKLKFKLRELRGLVSDKITDDAKSVSVTAGSKTPNMGIEIAVFNKQRILKSVVECFIDDKSFNISKEVEKLPRNIYNWVIKEIDTLNKLDEEEEKNLDGD